MFQTLRGLTSWRAVLGIYKLSSKAGEIIRDYTRLDRPLVNVGMLSLGPLNHGIGVNYAKHRKGPTTPEKSYSCWGPDCDCRSCRACVVHEHEGRDEVESVPATRAHLNAAGNQGREPPRGIFDGVPVLQVRFLMIWSAGDRFCCFGSKSSAIRIEPRFSRRHF